MPEVRDWLQWKNKSSGTWNWHITAEAWFCLIYKGSNGKVKTQFNLTQTAARVKSTQIKTVDVRQVRLLLLKVCLLVLYCTSEERLKSLLLIALLPTTSLQWLDYHHNLTLGHHSQWILGLYWSYQLGGWQLLCYQGCDKCLVSANLDPLRHPRRVQQVVGRIHNQATVNKDNTGEKLRKTTMNHLYHVSQSNHWPSTLTTEWSIYCLK